MKRNIILAVAFGYSLPKLEPFLASWRENVTTAELVILARDCDDAFYEAAAALGVVVLDAMSRRPYAVMGARHFMYRDVLRAHRRNVDSVLLSDARDVVFQRDPFDVRRDHPVVFAAEDNVLGDCPYNRWWLTRIYGEDTARELGGLAISCAGTTMGTTDGILGYLDLMCGEIDAHSDMVEENGDQGFHNYILYRLKPQFIHLDRADRFVKTLGYTDPDRIGIGANGVLVGGLPAAPVLHQWDRHEVSRDYVQGRYRLAESRSD